MGACWSAEIPVLIEVECRGHGHHSGDVTSVRPRRHSRHHGHQSSVRGDAESTCADVHSEPWSGQYYVYDIVSALAQADFVDVHTTETDPQHRGIFTT